MNARSPLARNSGRTGPEGPLTVLAATLLAVSLLACASGRPGGPGSHGKYQAPPVTAVETAPVETMLDHPDIPDAWRVWPEMIGEAKSTLDLAAFYVSNTPGSRLEPTLRAIEKAGERGVKVRVLADAGFYRTYPASLDRLSTAPGVRVRLIDFRAVAGGPMHAKYFVVDRREAFVGSQNFDWRALEHIHEMGLRISIPAYARRLERIFAADWKTATPLDSTAVPFAETPVQGDLSIPFLWIEGKGDTARAWPAMSPKDHIPDLQTWDLPRIVKMLDAARDSIHVTVLAYSPVGRDGTYWETLDDALRRAAVRGVRVELLVSDWAKRKPGVDFLKSLAVIPGIEVRFVTIPQASTGFIPFARVTHAKYMTADGKNCWLGTGNWEKGYFFHLRNVGIAMTSRAVTAVLDRDFLTLWNSPYAYPVRPDVEYQPPRIRE